HTSSVLGSPRLLSTSQHTQASHCHPSYFERSLFFFHDTATTEIYTLSLHDALPIFFLNPQCLASISRWITASSSWKRFCLFVCRALSSIMVICMLTAIRLLLTFVMSLYLLLRS